MCLEPMLPDVAYSQTALSMESEAGRQRMGLDAVIGLGANLGNPEVALRGAIRELMAVGRLTGVSELYRTLPVGGPPQPDFFNAAVRFAYSGLPEELLAEALRIERLAGRERRERWGPRTLDLDILWIAGARVDRPGLIVPHPRLRERAFALRPLLDVAPDAVDPADGMAYVDVLRTRGEQGIERLGSDWGRTVVWQLTRGMDRPWP
jgi:2-amino-4-hydroxy-6-hydroxymethyldihydropteridine diphosphokinase